MKDNFLVLAMFFASFTSYAQLIDVPWPSDDNDSPCKLCRTQIPINPFATIDEIETMLTMIMVEEGLDSPQVEISPLSANSSGIYAGIKGVYTLVIRSKNEVILVSSFEH